MSNRATEWAYQQPVVPSMAKFVLVTLADFANTDAEAWPKVETLCKMVGLKERQVREHLDRLVELGLVEKEQRRRTDGSRSSNLYRLAMPEHTYPDVPVNNRRSTAASQPAPERRDNRRSTAGHEPSVEPSESANADSLLSAREQQLVPLEITTIEDKVLHALTSVAIEKVAHLDSNRIVTACRDFPDRDHVGEGQAFAFWHLQGRGKNRRMRDLSAAWRNWLRGAAPADTTRPGAGQRGGSIKRGPQATAADFMAIAERARAAGV